MQTITDSKSAPRVMLDALEDLSSKGFIVIAVIEQAFEGSVAPLLQHDVGVNDPMNITVAQFFMPHGDHYHEWIITLAKAEVDVTSRRLETDLVTALKMMDMDQRATVHADGHA